MKLIGFRALSYILSIELYRFVQKLYVITDVVTRSRLQLVGLQAAMICFVELEGLVPYASNALISTSCNWLTFVCSEFAT